MKVLQCRVCDSRALEPVLDLGTLPLANRFLRPQQLQDPEPRFPLRVVLCLDCGLVQLDEEVPREVLFKDYIYVSGTSDLVSKHADWLAQTLTRQYHLGPRDLVMEAASNDGTVLKAFRWQGPAVLGIEPAENIAAQARDQGIPTVADFFDDRLARTLHAGHGPARLFLARHVLAHVSDLHGFVQGIKRVLAGDGVAIIEVPHLAALLREREFDTIYHEHLCYFSAGVLQTLFRRFGLAIFDVDQLPIHGGSLLLHVTHEGVASPSPRLEAVLREEEALQLGSLATWQRFTQHVADLREQLPAFLDGLLRRGWRLAGYGAPAKGNTLLCWCGIGPDRLPYLVDKSPSKQGLLTPGQHIPVYTPARLLDDQPDATLILAWNFAAEVIRQQAEYRQRGGRFALPLPVPQLVDPHHDRRCADYAAPANPG